MSPHHEIQRGLTLVEMLIVLVTTCLVASAAAPALVKLTEHRRLAGAAAQLETELNFARSTAVASNRTLRISFESDAQSSCYVMHTGAAHQCRCGEEVPVCDAEVQAYRSQRFDASTPVSLSSNVSSMAFDATQGTVTPTSTLELRGRSGSRIRLIVNVMGRVRSCSPAGEVAGLRPC